MKALTQSEVCGTFRGYNKHKNSGTEVCDPCRAACSARSRARRAGTFERPSMSRTEVVAEIDWMLSLGQGQHYILKAIDYMGRHGALEALLHRAGRGDLVERLLKLDKVVD